MFAVMIREKGGEQRQVDFEKDEVSIGRIQGNDIMLPKGNISKRHARIMIKDDKFVIVDLRSTNGTYVNGHKISSPMVISGEDKVYIGDFVLQLMDEANGAAYDELPHDQEHEAPHDEPMHADEAPHEEMEEPVDLPEEEEDDDSTRSLDYKEQMPAPTSQAAPPVEPVRAAPAAAHTFDDVVPPEAEKVVAESALDELTEFEQYIRVLAMLHERAGREVFAGRDIDSLDFSNQWEELENAVYAVVERGQAAGEVPGFLDIGGLTTDILYEYTALGPIEYFLADDRVTEIEVNAYNQIYVRRGDQRTLEWKSFSTPAALMAVVERLARGQGAEGETRSPILHGRLEDGTVFRGLTPPLSPLGPTLVFRKPRREVLTMQQLVEDGVLSAEMAQYLELRVGRDRATVVVAGRPGSGRTSVLNALAHLIPDGERVALVEETQELFVPHANVIRLDPSEGALQYAHELRPDRVVLGHLGQEVVLPFLRLATGRTDGCMTTAYARSPEDLFARLRSSLDVEDDVGDPRVQDSLIGLALEVIVMTERDADGSVRVSRIAEVVLSESGNISANDVFRHEGEAGHVRHGEPVRVA